MSGESLYTKNLYSLLGVNEEVRPKLDPAPPFLQFPFLGSLIDFFNFS